MRIATIALFFLVLIGGIMAMNRADQLPVRNKAELGRKLFTEKILSKDSSVSCASCHNPQFAFADTAAFSMGIHQTPTRRNTPSVLNMKNRPYFFWDGRAASLEQQALMPIENKDEMGLPVAEAVARLNRNKEYRLCCI
jgi:cytochrome c peroxidase